MKINKLIHIVLAINIGVLCFALMACSSSKMNLVDEYYIYSPDEFHETYYLNLKSATIIQYTIKGRFMNR